VVGGRVGEARVLDRYTGAAAFSSRPDGGPCARLQFGRHVAPFAGITPQVLRVDAGGIDSRAPSQPASPPAPLCLARLPADATAADVGAGSVNRPPSLGHASARHDPLHALAGELGDPLEVCVVVQDRQPGTLRAGGDQQVWQWHGAVL
jgi:hypothetical protein